MTIRERLDRLDGPQKMMWLVFIWLLLPAILWIWRDERTLPDIRGAWASPDCEEIVGQNGASRLRRSLKIDDMNWRLKIDFYGDEGCATELFSLNIEGPYDLGPKSMDVRDATTARFDLQKMILTPRSNETAAAFGEAGCASGSWKVGEGQEVTRFGCLGLVPTRSSCPAEYDIVKIQNGALYLGDRSQGMCVPDRYPNGFAPTPLRLLDFDK